MPPPVSIVVPAFNEARRLPPTLRALAELARTQLAGLEIVVVVEHSPDGTLELARELARQQADSSAQIIVIDGGPQRGKGHAVRTGMLQAGGGIIFFMDADLSVPLAEVPRFLEVFAAEPGTAVLVGNRRHPGSRITRSQGWVRRNGGRVFNWLLGRLGLTGCRDTQCGFKAFRREAAQAIFSRQTLDGFIFDVEVLLLAQQLGYHVRDLPVEWINSPETKVHLVRDAFAALRDAWRVSRTLRQVHR